MPRYVCVPGYYSYNRSTYVWVIDGSYRVPRVEERLMFKASGNKHPKVLREAKNIGNNSNKSTLAFVGVTNLYEAGGNTVKKF